MQSSFTFTVDSAVFDERNLMSAAGLVPLLELAERTGLSELIGEHEDLATKRVKAECINEAVSAGVNGTLVLRTYGTDADFWRVQESTEYPASWHRIRRRGIG